MNKSETKHDWDVRRTLAELTERYAEQAPEEILEPEIEIVDCHHHLWDRPPQRYLLEAFRDDFETGHRIVATVFVECRAMWRASGPEAMKPVGETEFANGLAAQSASGGYGPTRVNDGIVGYADLRRGNAVVPVLEAHVRAGGGRFRGVRNRCEYEPSIGAYGKMRSSKGMMQDPDFLIGLSCLAAAGLVYDSWQFHPQIAEVTEMARAVPEAVIVLNHLGGVLGVGPFALQRNETFARWKVAMTDLAGCPNVYVKLGGLGMPNCGFGFNTHAAPPDSETLAAAWRPFVETAVELFGAERCMFESNFPVDKQTCTYPVLWNAFKRIAAGCSGDEKQALFSGTASKVYRLDQPA
ncbi:amidohydrolase family protein [Pseudochelatococcus sp. B33]